MKQSIETIRQLRRKTKTLRTLILGAMLLGLGAWILTISGDVKRLTNPGPAQVAFFDNFTGQMQSQVQPQLEAKAQRLLKELPPILSKQVALFQQQTPQLQAYVLQEGQALQTAINNSTQARIEKLLEDILRENQPALKKTVDLAALQPRWIGLTTRVSYHVTEKLQKLSEPHAAALDSIQESLDTIRNTERNAPQPAAIDTLAMTVDLFRHFTSQDKQNQ